MGVVPLKDIIRPAFEARYGVPAINIFNDLTMEAVLAAAEEANSPVILQTSVKTVRSIGSRQLFDMWQSLTRGIHVPVALHLDHCPDREVITECLKAGWNSVLFDASNLPVEENQRQTIEVVAEARHYDAQVEGEIEAITGVEDDHGSDNIAPQQSLDTALNFIDATGIDVFAPSIGNAHGSYKAAPVLDVGRVSEIVKARNMPIALHGGSGLSPEQFSDLIARGCAKVNISTALKETYMQSSLDFLKQAEQNNKWDPPSLFKHTRADIITMVDELTQQFGSAGKGGR
ncbi:class II fructose-bisphosphate aldolase [Arthrobacter sp. H14-L1]|uniref:class II fructose-bisphosphate aldolase n=1 Tax=Arthrobacter sp. H14-L1 TaxID=2996697 RepID=UPI00226D6C9F|nr:class II fructose-bisphosphate aldolase [Arthrobacter sp. H14-L1]MCY0905908.1 class II fructose-bisphosphate aldolase [Arthrobacter sp. H14-L1]